MKEGITTKTAEKKEIPEGNWYKCPSCKTVIASQEHEESLWVCSHCDHHERIGSHEYFSILFDEGKYRELQAKMSSANPLSFTDTKNYEDRLKASMAKTGLKDAIRTGVGEVGGRQMVISSMDFGFIGGSMGSVVGEKIARAIDYSIKNGLPYVCVTKSGGARMMEAGLSLMQMAKTSARLSLLAKAGLPYVCILTDPTTGGVTASFAMLGDLHIAEPNALIGFAIAHQMHHFNTAQLAAVFVGKQPFVAKFLRGLCHSCYQVIGRIHLLGNQWPMRKNGGHQGRQFEVFFYRV